MTNAFSKIAILSGPVFVHSIQMWTGFSGCGMPPACAGVTNRICGNNRSQSVPGTTAGQMNSFSQGENNDNFHYHHTDAALDITRPTQTFSDSFRCSDATNNSNFDRDSHGDAITQSDQGMIDAVAKSRDVTKKRARKVLSENSWNVDKAQRSIDFERTKLKQMSKHDIDVEIYRAVIFDDASMLKDIRHAMDAADTEGLIDLRHLRINDSDQIPWIPNKEPFVPGDTLLLHAIREQKMNVVDEMLQFPNINVNLLNRKTEEFPLMLLVENKNVDMLKKFVNPARKVAGVSRIVQINARTPDGTTALMRACTMWDEAGEQMVDFLCSVPGIETNKCNKSGDTAFSNAHENMWKGLVAAGADPTFAHGVYGTTVLMKVISNAEKRYKSYDDLVDAVDRLLQLEITHRHVMYIKKKRKSLHSSGLHTSSSADDDDDDDDAYSSKPAFSITNNDYESAVSLAVKFGYDTILKKLFRHANLTPEELKPHASNSITADGQTLLQKAYSNYRKACELVEKDQRMISLEMRLIADDHESSSQQADDDDDAYFGVNPFAKSALADKGSQFSTFHFLLIEGVNPNIPFPSSTNTILFDAINHQDLKIVTLLLQTEVLDDNNTARVPVDVQKKCQNPGVTMSQFIPPFQLAVSKKKKAAPEDKETASKIIGVIKDYLKASSRK